MTLIRSPRGIVQSSTYEGSVCRQIFDHDRRCWIVPIPADDAMFVTLERDASKISGTRVSKNAGGERTDSHSGQTNRIIVTTANRIGRLYPPEVELLEPRTAWKQESPQVAIGIHQVRLRL